MYVYVHIQYIYIYMSLSLFHLMSTLTAASIGDSQGHESNSFVGFQSNALYLYIEVTHRLTIDFP